MKELELRSEIPRSTIHYYLRENVLSPPHKTAANAALYSEAHLRELQAVRLLRSGETAVPLPLVRRVVDLVRRGIEPEVAAGLERAVFATAPRVDELSPMTIEDLSKAAGTSLAEIEQLIDIGLLVPLPGVDGRPFDDMDLQIVRVLQRASEATGLPVDAGAPIAKAIGEISDYEMSLSERVVRDLPDARAAEIRRELQETVNLLHAYLFFRSRLRGIWALPMDREP